MVVEVLPQAIVVAAMVEVVAEVGAVVLVYHAIQSIEVRSIWRF